MRLASTYRFIAILLLATGSIGIVAGFTIYRHDGEHYQARHSQVLNSYDPQSPKGINAGLFNGCILYIQQQAQQAAVPVDAETAKALDKVYTETYKHYAANIIEIGSSFNYLIALIIIGILIIVFKIQIIQVPFFKLDIPGKLVYLIVGMGLTYFWIHIGLLTNDSIDCRLALISIIKQTEAKSLNPEFSLINTLSDAAFIDNMTSFYYDVFSLNVPDRGAPMEILKVLGLFGMYGSLLGLAMGVSLISYLEFIKESANRSSRHLGKATFYFCLMVFVAATICVVIKFHHMSNFFGYIWLVAASVMLARSILPDRLPQQAAPVDGADEKSNGRPVPLAVVPAGASEKLHHMHEPMGHD